MKVCPYCHKEFTEGNWTCPYCHQYVPTNQVGTGHATQGDFSKLEKEEISTEDEDIIRDDNHISSSLDDGDDVEPAQPYSFVEHNNGDRD